MAYTPTLRALAAWWPVTTVLVAMAGHGIVNVPVEAQTGDRRVDVLIAFDQRPGAPAEAIVRAAGASVRFRFHLVPAVAATLPAQAVAALRNNPRIVSVQPDVRITAFDLEMDRSWGVRRIGAAPLHAANLLGAGVRVAVLDTGIDYTHPDLAVNYAGGHDFVNNDDDPWDDNGHGTHVAGTIAARDDDAGVVGVAPQATLFALKVLDASGQGLFSHVVAALEWAVDHDVRVTNNSYGSSIDPGTIVQQAFDNAEAAGVLHVAAAGNSGNCAGTGDNVGFPARYPSVIAVAATDSSDISPCFSSTGPNVELSAPGVAVNSTVPGGGYQEASGTSMASPHVAGTAAVILSQGAIQDGNGNGRINDEIRQRLIATAQDLGLPGRDTWYGYGLVDARSAADVTLPRDPLVTVALTMNKSLYLAGVDPTAQLTLVVRDENGASIPGLGASRFVTTVDGSGRTVTFTPRARRRRAASRPSLPLLPLPATITTRRP